MNFEVDLLKVILGSVLIVLSVYFYWFKNSIQVKASTRNGIIAGFISGILGGMFNIGGPPLVIYYFCALKDKLEYNASLQATFNLSAIYTIALHILYGNINTTVLKYTAVGVIAVSVGCSIGLWIFKKIEKETISKAIYSFMAIMGIMMIICCKIKMYKNYLQKTDDFKKINIQFKKRSVLNV